jgi:SAM-dependent methyltransferase
MIKRTQCASCNGNTFTEVYNFGEIPLAGSFPLDKDKNVIDYYPLSILMCSKCSLVQTDTLIEPEVLFKDYRYVSSVGMQKHFNSYADWLIQVEGVTSESEILEFGCNDGPLLWALNERGIKAKGIDPATNIIKLGIEKGLDIEDSFFNHPVASLKEWGSKFDYILSSNSFAHITDIKSVVKGVEYSLKDEGKFIFEVQYLVDLVDKFQFDFMYHEHLYYYTLTSLKNLLEPLGLKILDFERIPIHSGSIRVIAGKEKLWGTSNIDKIQKQIKLEEKYLNLNNFSLSIKKSLSDLKLFLDNNSNKKIVGYGASGRANTVIGTMGLNSHQIDYIIDESPERYYRFTSNGKIPILPPELIEEDVDYIIILAWNFADMIIEKTKHLGIPFIIPFPEIQIINE